MATVNPRRALVYKIQKRLFDLSASQLLQVADSIDDGSMTDRVDEPSEPELFDLIVDYIKSEKLGALEDGGMAQLLHLDDMLSDLVAMQSEAVRVAQTAPPENEGSTTIQQGCSTPPHREPSQPTTPPATPTTDIPRHSLHMDRDIHSLPPSPRNRDAHTNPSTENRDLHTFPSPAGRGNVMLARDLTTPALAKSPTTGFGGAPPGRVSLSSSMGDQVLRFNDVAALLPRREFKLHGGQISDVGSDMSYSSLCKQIDEGLHEGFTESEIIRTVIKITKPGTFREMLANKGDLTVDELKRFLRAHIRDKNSTELFQELSNAKQQDKENPQQFLYRIMGLKQRVLFESQQPGAEFSYDKRLVQGTFLHTLYQGLNEKNNHVRHDLKPLLTDLQVSDDFLLDQITKSMSEEAERLKRLGTVSKTRPVTVSTAQLDCSDSAKQDKVDTQLQANRAAIQELTAQVSSLTKHLAQMVKPADSVTPGGPCSTTACPQAPTTDNRGRCNDCVQQSKVSCPHCFVCGQAGHRAIGCLQRKLSGNGMRSLVRGNQ
ncbi:uncharacterized protein LOC122974049 [Thunnus albacares]|uniref:uncharacterized protein LOC122974049 n=1 Tax=Thunnus albacares TaxID=8236 RepID=UPI001CF70251|nr:uncharacterized protein LOC122974049 [Thunnus albacares]